MRSIFQRAVSIRAALVVGVMLLDGGAAEAGLFDKLKVKKRVQSPAVKIEKPTPRPRPRHRSAYRDAHGDAYINEALLAAAGDSKRKVVIDIGRQRAFLVIDGLVAIDTAISSARRGKHTPRGGYAITEKVRAGKVSTLYHVYMPYWMRLGQTTIGMHVGDLPGYPASAGCIRLPQSVAPFLFEHVSLGVPVEIVDFWDEAGLRMPHTMLRPVPFADT